MKRPAILLTVLGLALVFGFMGWALYAANQQGGSWTGGSAVLTLIIAGGVIGTGLLAAVLMWLAFYSARKGYDEAAHYGDEDGD